MRHRRTVLRAALALAFTTPFALPATALAAGVMLCRYGPLDTDAGLQTAFYHYNPSAAYVAEVLGYTHTYAAFSIPPVA